jgi:hypothetical protein
MFLKLHSYVFRTSLSIIREHIYCCCIKKLIDSFLVFCVCRTDGNTPCIEYVYGTKLLHCKLRQRVYMMEVFPVVPLSLISVYYIT